MSGGLIMAVMSVANVIITQASMRQAPPWLSNRRRATSSIKGKLAVALLAIENCIEQLADTAEHPAHRDELPRYAGRHGRVISKGLRGALQGVASSFGAIGPGFGAACLVCAQAWYRRA